jgi:hypothetical protein
MYMYNTHTAQVITANGYISDTQDLGPANIHVLMRLPAYHFSSVQFSSTELIELNRLPLARGCAESDWRVWRAARNASSVNGGRLPYSLGTVANAARTVSSIRRVKLPSDGFAPKVFTRKEGTMPRAPCLLCAASIPPHLPRSDDVEGENRASVRRRSRTHTGSCGRTSGQTKRDSAPSAFSQKQATRSAGYLGTRPTTPS